MFKAGVDAAADLSNTARTKRSIDRALTAPAGEVQALMVHSLGALQ
jgi:hypothetical protein